MQYEGSAENLAKLIRFSFDKIDEDMRNKILREIIDKDKAKKDIAYIVAQEFKNLPTDVKDSVVKLKKQIQDVIEERAKSNEYKILALSYIGDLWTGLDPHFVLEILTYLKSSGNSDESKLAGTLLEIFSKYYSGLTPKLV